MSIYRYVDKINLQTFQYCDYQVKQNYSSSQSTLCQFTDMWTKLILQTFQYCDAQVDAKLFIESIDAMPCRHVDKINFANFAIIVTIKLSKIIHRVNRRYAMQTCEQN